MGENSEKVQDGEFVLQKSGEVDILSANGPEMPGSRGAQKEGT